MPEAKVIAELVQAGGWTLFVLTVALAGVGLLRRLWVPGYLWLQERKDRLEANLQASLTAKALARVARQVATLARAVTALTKTVATLDDQLVTMLVEIRALREDVRQLRNSRRDGGGSDGG